MQFLRRLLGLKAEEKTKFDAEEQGPAQPYVGESREVKATAELPSQAPPSLPVQTRPLEPPKDFRTLNRRIKFGVASDMGGRANNEDAALTLFANTEFAGGPPPVGIFMVADGMGGHQDGEYASSLAVRTVAKHVMDEIIHPQLEEQVFSAEQKTIPEVLAEALSAANETIQTQVPGGGTTATCVVIRGNLAHFAHVGDSRAYLITDDNSMELITRDHLLVRRLQELGQLTAEEAEVHPQRNVLYRGLGQGEALEVDAATRRLLPSSRLLLCSDGLWGVIGEEGIKRILRDYDDPQEACDQMVKAANENGSTDNITVVLVQMPD